MTGYGAVRQEFDESEYRRFFVNLVGFEPHPYQVRVAAQLALHGRNLMIRAPTGAGKTWAVVAPFLYPLWRCRPARLIYALPLRTLAQGIYRQCQEAAERLGLPREGRSDPRGVELVRPFVTLQTGEQPDDPFFARGTVIVTTYDQLLSGLLDGPYGLSQRLHNINAAAVAGSLVVFDEFHLMEPSKAFLTAVALLHLFREMSQSVWMTATATEPLERILSEVLEAQAIPGSVAEQEEMLSSLPSVTQVRRRLLWEGTPLLTDRILNEQPCRSIVLLNTVDRAQAAFAALRAGLQARGLNVPVLMLHSRFFKRHRREKEEEIRSLFGRGSRRPAVLVATQVVEAGLDLSCDHLHTELCPMNALIQRAGRCARFEGEVGTVHVHGLPEASRPWLPYGDLASENANVTRTRSVLQERPDGVLDPALAAQLVEKVHGDEDMAALAEGWWTRLRTCISRIESNAIHRTPVRIADLIRGDDGDTIRVIVADRPPGSPGSREGLSLRRGSLRSLLASARGAGIGWVWTGEDDPWKPLTTIGDLSDTFVACLRTQVAAYDRELGLRLGTRGAEESPIRRPPPRPGYAPLRVESWVDHARRIADEAARRLEEEHGGAGLLAAGLEARFELSVQSVFEAARACAHLHDLGKLQDSWQRWAGAWQTATNSGYRHERLLAHTDFDPERADTQAAQQRLGVTRPRHAAASAYFGGAFLAHGLPSVSAERRTVLASACAAAILAHHGGWIPPNLDQEITPLCPGWEADLAAIGYEPNAADVQPLARRTDKRGLLELVLRPSVGPDEIGKYWPLVAYLTRALRLSDQRATAEGASRDPR